MRRQLTPDEYNRLTPKEKMGYKYYPDVNMYIEQAKIYPNSHSPFNHENLVNSASDRIGKQLNPNSSIPRNTGDNMAQITMDDILKWVPAITQVAGTVGGLINTNQAQVTNAQQFEDGLAEQRRVNATNAKLALDAQLLQKQVDQRNYDYMVAENKIQKEREDTAHQREVADLKAAGLSPLASLSGSHTGSVVSQASGVSPVVPQQDGSGLANLFATAMSNTNAMAGLRNDLMRDLFGAGSDLARQRIEHNFQSTQKTLDRELDLTKFTSRLDFDRDSLAQQKEIALQGLKRDYDQMSQDILKFSQDLDYRQSESEKKGFAEKWHISNFTYSSDKQSVARGREEYLSVAKDMANAIGDMLVVYEKGENSGEWSQWNAQASGAVGSRGGETVKETDGLDMTTIHTEKGREKALDTIIKKQPGSITKYLRDLIPYMSGSLGGGYGSGENKGSYEKYDRTRLFVQAMSNYNADHPFPIYRKY